MADVEHDLDIREDDVVVIRLTLRGRDGGEPLTLDETVAVRELPLVEGGAAGATPTLDADSYARLLASGDPKQVEQALQMLADFQEATAEFVAGGGTPPAERLADAVVDWVLETQPRGHTFTSDPSGEGYVISKNEINIAGPIDMNGERFWRVTAVGTWGC